MVRIEDYLELIASLDSQRAHSRDRHDPGKP
jgi:hypothetical protein